MSLQNQSNLFLELDPLIHKLNKENLHLVDFDNRVIINSITFTEVLDLIIHNPTVTLDEMGHCALALTTFLRKGEVLKMLRELSNQRSIPFTIARPEGNSHFSFYLKNIDYYLLECYGENAGTRDKRVDEYLENFIQHSALQEEIEDGSYKQAEDLFYMILCKAAERYFFLTDADLDQLIKWLTHAYNTETEIFSNSKAAREQRFCVELVTRKIYLNWTDIRGKITKGNN